MGNFNIAEEVRVEERFWHYVLENLPNRVFVLDREGRIIYANRAGLAGAYLEDVKGRKFYEVVCGTSEQPEGCKIKGKKGCIRFEFKGKSMVGLYNKIENGFILSIFEEFEREDVDELILMIRHSLGNAVNSIKTSIQVLRDFYEKLSEEKKIEFITRIMEDAGRLERLLAHLRDLSYLDKQSLRIFNIRETVREFVNSAQIRCLSSGIDFVFDVETDDIYINGNPDWLYEMLLVLLENSFEALQDAKKKMIELKVKKKDNKVLISFFDTGKGMSREVISKAFNVFYSTKKGGEGIGLFQLKKMVGLMNGRVWIESKEGEWTEVFIELPLAKK